MLQEAFPALGGSSCRRSGAFCRVFPEGSRDAAKQSLDEMLNEWLREQIAAKTWRAPADWQKRLALLHVEGFTFSSTRGVFRHFLTRGAERFGYAWQLPD